MSASVNDVISQLAGKEESACKILDAADEEKKKLYQDSLFDPKRTIRDEIKEHMVILETVKKRDGDLAAALLKEHISFTASEVDAQAELTQAQNTVIPRKSTQVI